MEIPALQPRIDLDQLSLQQMQTNSKVSDQAKLGAAAKEFESIFVRHFLKEGMKPMFKTSFTDNSAAAGIYQDLLADQLAHSISRSGSFGVARSLERQLTRQTAATPPPPTSSATHE